MNIRSETLRNFASIAALGEGATTPELADAFQRPPVNVATMLKRYESAGYVTCEVCEEIREDKNGREVTRKLHRWSPTDKLKDLVDLHAAKKRDQKNRRIANSVWQWGQV